MIQPSEIIQSFSKYVFNLNTCRIYTIYCYYYYCLHSTYIICTFYMKKQTHSLVIFIYILYQTCCCPSRRLFYRACVVICFSIGNTDIRTDINNETASNMSLSIYSSVRMFRVFFFLNNILISSK